MNSLSKKIAVICHYELKPNRIGGMDRFFVAYDAACKEKGAQVDWFFSNCKTHPFYKDLNINASEGISAEEKFVDKTKGFKLYDIVVTHFLELCTPFFQKIKNEQQAYIIAVDHNPRPLHGFPLKKRLKNKIKGRFYSRYINCFVGVSQYTANCIIKDYGSALRKKTKVIYNGIDTSIYKKRTEKNPGKFIVASHLRESKGIQDLIEAVNLLNVENKALLKIDVFGDGPMEAELKNKVKTYKLEQNFSFKGSSSELPELLQQYSFLLQPTYMECFSLSILESLAANVPVITTPVGGNPEIITEGKNGYIFKAGNITALKTILEKLLKGKYKIENEVNPLVEKEYPLTKMIAEHLKLLPCT